MVDGQEIRVVDWPTTFMSGRSQKEFRADGSRSEEVTIDNKAVGRFSGEGVRLDRKTLLTEARNILRETLYYMETFYGFTSSLTAKRLLPGLYTPIPARDTEHTLKKNGCTFPFRGSCAGFVEHCIALARVDIVQDDNPKDDLPGWKEEELSVLAPILGITDLSRLEKHRQEPEYVDIKPPFHFLLPGYQLSAFAADGPYPYKVRSKEEAFLGSCAEEESP